MAAVLAVALLSSIHFFLFVDRYSVEILFSDQWDFLDEWFVKIPSVAELFVRQHGPHREGVALIADKYLYELTHWSSRAESFMLAGSIVLAMALALRLKQQLFGRLAYSDVVIPVVFLSTTQYENVIGALNPAHSVFPLVMVLLYCLSLQVRQPLQRYPLLLVLNFLLIYTGFGIFMGVVTIGVFALACYRQVRKLEQMPFALPFVGLLIACLSLGSFFLDYVFLPSVDCFEFPYRKPSEYPRFMARMFATATGVGRSVRTLTGWVLLTGGGVILATHALRAARTKSATTLPLTITVLIGFSLLFSANAAVGRVCLGLNAATASRYVTLLLPAVLGTYFFLLTVEWKRTRNVAIVLLALMFIRTHVHTLAGVHWLADGKGDWAECYKRTENIEYCDSNTNFQIYPFPERTHLKRKLEYLKANRLNLYADAD